MNAQVDTPIPVRSSVMELKATLGKGGVMSGEKPVGREAQFDFLQKYITQLLEFRKGGAIYITGVSGTGKSVTVHAVLGRLWTSIGCMFDPPALVSINCMNLMSPRIVYDRIWEGWKLHQSIEDPSEIVYPCQSMQKTTSEATMKEMREWISNVSSSADRWTGSAKGRKRIKRKDQGEHRALVVFLDEIDRLITTSSNVLIELFAMATSSRRFIVIGASNVINLTEMWMPELETASCVPEVISFPSYRPNDVSSILRKMAVDANSVLTTGALEYMARKACTIGKGDMRSILRLCLSALSIFDYGYIIVDSISIVYVGNLGDDSEAIDVKAMMHAFEQIGNGDEDGISEVLKALPLDQQILLLSILQLVQPTNGDEDTDPTEHPKKKRRTRDKTHPNAVDLNTIYQRYMSICKKLCLDASAKTEVSLMLTMLEDSSILGSRKKPKQFHLTVSLPTLRTVLASCPLLAGMM